MQYCVVMGLLWNRYETCRDVYHHYSDRISLHFGMQPGPCFVSYPVSNCLRICGPLTHTIPTFNDPKEEAF